MTGMLEPWKLRLSKNEHWQTQYTGFDPSLVLPEGLTEEKSMQFLRALALFVDRQPKQPHGFYKRLESVAPDQEKRFAFNCGIPLLFHKSSYLIQYIRAKGGYSVKQMETLGFPYSEGDPLRPESFAAAVELFASACTQHSSISARGFLDHHADKVKVQYVEPMLLYIGQSIKEVYDVVHTQNGFSAEDLAYHGTAPARLCR